MVGQRTALPARSLVMKSRLGKESALDLNRVVHLRSSHHIPEPPLSNAFIADVLQESLSCTSVTANQAAANPIEAIVRDLKKEGGFTLPSFGTLWLAKTKTRKAINPRTGEAVKVKAGKTVRFKASPVLKKAV